MIVGMAYTVYILIDTHSIIKNARSKGEELADYVMGTTLIYSDIINNFVVLLQLVAKWNE